MALATEFGYFMDHHNDWVKDYPGKYMAIHGLKILGIHDTFEIAESETIREYSQGECLIIPCIEGPNAYLRSRRLCIP